MAGNVYESKLTPPALFVGEDAIGILPLRGIVSLKDWKERYYSVYHTIPYRVV
jgi:hypothetical protein